MVFTSQRRETPLFLIAIMAAVTSMKEVIMSPKQSYGAPQHNTDPVSGAASKWRFHEMLEAENMAN